MKIHIVLIFLVTLPLILIGADPAPGEPVTEVEGPAVKRIISIWQMLIPVAVPLLIAGLKALIPKLPKNLLPFIAPIIGAVIDILLNLTGVGGGMGAVGAFLGSAGVGVREMFDQSVKPSEPIKSVK